MRIDSVSTWDRRFRMSLFLLMCVGMGGWFAYDGFKGYPAKNLEWARQRLPEKPEQLRTNPLASEHNLLQIKPGTTLEALEQRLGQPALIQPPRLLYVGNEVRATVELDPQGKVARVRTERLDATANPNQTSTLITAARLEYITPGMSAAAVRAQLGQPKEDLPESRWYVGPAAYAEFRIKNGKVVQEPEIQVSHQPSETDILLQKILAAALALLAVGVAIKVYLIFKTHIVLDDEGLVFNGRRVPWEAMRELITTDYNRKGWLDLAYEINGARRSLRLDSYHITNFDEILAAICEHKGFKLPVRVRDEDVASTDTAESDPRDNTTTE